MTSLGFTSQALTFRHLWRFVLHVSEIRKEPSHQTTQTKYRLVVWKNILRFDIDMRGWISLDVGLHDFFSYVNQWNNIIIAVAVKLHSEGPCLAKPMWLLGVHQDQGWQEKLPGIAATCHQPLLLEAHRSPLNHQPHYGGCNLCF